jgi:hypothetical protein
MLSHTTLYFRWRLSGEDIEDYFYQAKNIPDRKTDAHKGKPNKSLVDDILAIYPS